MLKKGISIDILLDKDYRDNADVPKYTTERQLLKNKIWLVSFSKEMRKVLCFLQLRTVELCD